MLNPLIELLKTEGEKARAFQAELFHKSEQNRMEQQYMFLKAQGRPCPEPLFMQAARAQGVLAEAAKLEAAKAEAAKAEAAAVASAAKEAASAPPARTPTQQAPLADSVPTEAPSPVPYTGYPTEEGEVDAANSGQYKSLIAQVLAESFWDAKQERDPTQASIHLPLLEEVMAGWHDLPRPWEVEELLKKIDDYCMSEVPPFTMAGTWTCVLERSSATAWESCTLVDCQSGKRTSLIMTDSDGDEEVVVPATQFGGAEDIEETCMPDGEGTET
ncbi:hypothetical protein CYMTET_54209 [Cymbomonas tetramitiformis]|uniref:Uncharacterized protein n=1 Tax=Cymbomonas tetramitiformis TaxID=36881 RepID=A0AAE0BH69_9CHLO|nr:hypothetical protein CYMTET_54209 [Cymbomonas tetramitiformis]